MKIEYNKIRERGYTLLEILTVLVLLALLAGIAMPKLTAVYAGVQWANERDDVLRQIAGLGFSAFRRGQDFELSPYPEADHPGNTEQQFAGVPLELPSGWKLEAVRPIIYKSNGICLGGRLRLICGERSLMLQIRAPQGQPEIIAE